MTNKMLLNVISLGHCGRIYGIIICIIIEKTVLAFMKNALLRLLLLYASVELFYDDSLVVVVMVVLCSIFWIMDEFLHYSQSFCHQQTETYNFPSKSTRLLLLYIGRAEQKKALLQIWF